MSTDKNKQTRVAYMILHAMFADSYMPAEVRYIRAIEDEYKEWWLRRPNPEEQVMKNVIRGITR